MKKSNLVIILSLALIMLSGSLASAKTFKTHKENLELLPSVNADQKAEPMAWFGWYMQNGEVVVDVYAENVPEKYYMIGESDGKKYFMVRQSNMRIARTDIDDPVRSEHPQKLNGRFVVSRSGTYTFGVKIVSIRDKQDFFETMLWVDLPEFEMYSHETSYNQENDTYTTRLSISPMNEVGLQEGDTLTVKIGDFKRVLEVQEDFHTWGSQFIAKLVLSPDEYEDLKGDHYAEVMLVTSEGVFDKINYIYIMEYPM